MAQVTLTPAQIAAGLTKSGFRLGPNQFSFSVPTAGSVWPGYTTGEPTTGYAVLNAAQADAFRLAIRLWDDLIAVNFTETADDASTRGEVRAAFTTTDDDTAAYAYSGSPRSPGSATADIWISNDYVGRSFAVGTYDFEVLVHEIGHALGLKHSFEAPVLPAAFENRRFTVMSYTEPLAGVVTSFFTTVTGGIRSTSAYVVVGSPMVVDIAAVQAIYGADTTTRGGNTVYSFDQTGNYLQSIYDAGGDDTIDLSNFTRTNTVDLTPGSYSSIGEFPLDAQIAYWTAQYPQSATFIRNTLSGQDLFVHGDNLGIALNTIIENATGGSAADRISGNAVANRLRGLGGNDVILGLDGDDLIDGGAGDDVLTGGAGADLFVFGDSGQGADRIVDFTMASDRFDLGGRSFSGIAESGGNSVLTHAGGTVQLDGVTGLTLAQANARILGARTVLDTQLVAVLPGDGGVGLPVTADIRLVFAGAVARGAGTIVLAKADGTVVESFAATSAQLTLAGTVLTVNPARPLDPGASYMLSIAAGALTVAGAAYGGLTGYDFATLATAADPASQYFLVMPAGARAIAQGSGDVFGDPGRQVVEIRDTPGRIVLDPSFNRGGDTIQIAGAAGGFTAQRSGSSIVLSDGDSTILIPVGIVGADIQFADRLATLKFDSPQATAVRLGDQLVTTTAAAVSTANGTATATGATDPGLASQLILTPGGHAVASGVRVDVYGSAAAETVQALASAVTFDGSFNRGGDIMILGGRAGDYSAVRSGSTMVLTSVAQSVSIAVGIVGIVGATVRFADGDRSIGFEQLAAGGAGGMRIGGQAVGTTAVQLTANTPTDRALDQDDDASLATAFSLSAAGGDIRFVDDAAVAHNVRLTGLGRGDQIALQGSASDYLFSASGGDVTIQRIGGGGVFSTTVIAGIADPAIYVANAASLATAAGFDFVTFTL